MAQGPPLPVGTWVHPPLRELKLNFDAAICPSMLATTCVCRDLSGVIMFATSKLHQPLDPLDGVGRAANLTVRKAWSHGLQNIVVKGDCSVLVDVLQDSTT